MPEPFNPLEMAKRGFECEGNYKVRCSNCDAKLDFAHLQCNFEPNAIQRAVNDLNDCHMPNCLVDDYLLS